jgi:transcriptional regulator with XRE-family HTH domain
MSERLKKLVVIYMNTWIWRSEEMLEDWEKDLIEELRDPEFAALYGADRAKSGYGLALLHARQAANITQKELSEKLGVRQPYIAQLESGEANPTLGTAGKMLAALGLKMVISVEPLAPQEIIIDYTPNSRLSPAFLEARDSKATG